MIVEQVNFVDVQQPTVGSSEKARFKGALTFCKSSLNVDSSAHSILSGSER
jgi:hypothetical protein